MCVTLPGEDKRQQASVGEGNCAGVSLAPLGLVHRSEMRLKSATFSRMTLGPGRPESGR